MAEVNVRGRAAPVLLVLLASAGVLAAATVPGDPAAEKTAPGQDPTVAAEAFFGDLLETGALYDYSTEMSQRTKDQAAAAGIVVKRSAQEVTLTQSETQCAWVIQVDGSTSGARCGGVDLTDAELAEVLAGLQG